MTITAGAPPSPLPAAAEPGLAHRVAGRRVAGMLLFRLVAFAVLQGGVAGLLALSGSLDPWSESAAWWPLAAVGANLLNLSLLARWARIEGFSLRAWYVPVRARLRADLPALVGVILGGAVLAALPNLALATALFGDAQTALDLLVSPLPLWAGLVAVVLFPITTALAELPTYYGYVQPRLRTSRVAVVLLVPALFHALQHAALPLVFQWEFIAWRALMFLPFALLLAAVLRRRPSLLPYLLVVHFLLDLQAGLMVLAAVPA
jgi:hypothetical protein